MEQRLREHRISYQGFAIGALQCTAVCALLFWWGAPRWSFVAACFALNVVYVVSGVIGSHRLERQEP